MIAHPANPAKGLATAQACPQFKRLLTACFLLTILTTAALAQSQVTLAWDPGSGANGVGYRLYRGGVSQTYTNAVNVGNRTSVTVSNLLAGSTYYFAVTAYDSNGLESNFSTELAYTATATNPPPVLPPSVVLTAPASGTSYSAPATINLSASVTANGHTINQVQFYNGTTLLASDATSPYTFAWSGVSAGTYSLTARVVYDGGSTLASAAASITVTNPPPVVPPSVVLTAPASGTSYSAPATINLSASVTANGHTINQVQFYNGTTLLASDATSPYTFAWSGVSAGTYSLTARVVYDGSSTLASAAASITVSNPPAVPTLPVPWQAVKIGNAGVAGSVVASNGVFTVAGAGTIGGAADSFHFVYQPLSADGEIRARVSSSQKLTGDWAGVMIRESLTPGSTFGLMGVVSGNAASFRVRQSTGGNAKGTPSVSATPPNIWVRIVRTGNTLYGYKSTDGVKWGSAVGHYKVPMAANVYIGLAVASGSASTLNTAVLSNLTVVP